MRIISILILFVLSSFVIPVRADNEFAKIYEELPSDLKERAMSARANITQDWIPAFADSLETRGKGAGNDKYILIACLLRSYNAFVHLDSVQFCTNNDIVLELTDKMGYEEQYFTETTNRVSFYLNTNHYYQAARHARELIAKAKERKNEIGMFSGFHSLGNIFEKRGFFKKALLSFQDALKCLEEKGELYSVHRTLCQQDIAFEHYYLGNYAEVERICGELIANDPDDVRSIGVLSAVYFRQGRFNEFRRLYEHVDTLSVSRLGNKAQAYEYIKANMSILYLATQGKIDDAIKLADTRSFLERTNRKMEVYMYANRWEEAYKCEKALHEYYDSVLYVSNESDMIEMNAELENVYKLNDKEKQIVTLRYHVILGFVITVVVFVVAIIVWRRNRIVSQKNKALASTIDEMLDYKEKYLKEHKENVSRCVADDVQDVSVDTDTEQNDLSTEFDDVRRFIYELTSRQLYTNPDFDKNILLQELHIKKSSFNFDFERQVGVTIPKYVLRLRMEHAAQMIKEHPDFTLEAIAAASGIPSRTTFYRNFTSHFGFTPSAYRSEHEIDV